jgi:hypothetical protein
MGIVDLGAERDGVSGFFNPMNKKYLPLGW